MLFLHLDEKLNVLKYGRVNSVECCPLYYRKMYHVGRGRNATLYLWRSHISSRKTIFWERAKILNMIKNIIIISFIVEFFGKYLDLFSCVNGKSRKKKFTRACKTASSGGMKTYLKSRLWFSQWKKKQTRDIGYSFHKFWILEGI